MVGSRIRKHWIIDDRACLSYLDEAGKWKGLQAIGMLESERQIGKAGDDRDTVLSAQFCQGCQTLCDLDSQSLGHRK